MIDLLVIQERRRVMWSEVLLSAQELGVSLIHGEYRNEDPDGCTYGMCPLTAIAANGTHPEKDGDLDPEDLKALGVLDEGYFSGFVREYDNNSHLNVMEDGRLIPIWEYYNHDVIEYEKGREDGKYCRQQRDKIWSYR